MANLVQTGGNVVTVSTPASDNNAIERRYLSGQTIAGGAPVYLGTDNLLRVADNDVDAATAAAIGIALHGAAAGQPLAVQRSGVINLGATLVVGETYVVSATAGAIAPIGDLTTGKFVTILGVATSAANCQLGIIASGTQRA